MEETKVRFRFIRVREARYLSHLDVVRQMVMAINRAGIRPQFSQGFHPNIRMSFSHPVPVGMASFAEYGDLLLAQSIDPQEFVERMNRQLKPCFCIKQARLIDKRAPSLMQAIDVVSYVFKTARHGRSWEEHQKAVLDFPRQSLHRVDQLMCPKVDIVIWTLFVYTKSEKERMVFKSSDFLSHVKGLSNQYKFSLINYYKKEAFVRRGDSLVSPMLL